MPRPWRRRPVAVGEALLAVARAIGMEGRLKEIDILRIWPRAVGRTAARHSLPAGLRDGTLLVYVANSAWLHRISMARQDIVRNLNDHLDAPVVKAVRLRIGPVDEPAGIPGGRSGPRANRGAAGLLVHRNHQADGLEDPAIGRALAPVKDLPFGDVVQRILRRQAALEQRR